MNKGKIARFLHRAGVITAISIVLAALLSGLGLWGYGLYEGWMGAKVVLFLVLFFVVVGICGEVGDWVNHHKDDDL